jgi:serine/threonine protein kinase
MTDPVILTTGESFERHAIEAHFARVATNPTTGLPLENRTLAPNHALRNAIEQWQKSRADATAEPRHLLPKDSITVNHTKVLSRSPGKTTYQGSWQGEAVAVTCLKPTEYAAYPEQLAQAGNFPHVVKFCGLVQTTEEVQLITELAPGGSLDQTLISAVDHGRPLPLSVLLEIAFQVSVGMTNIRALDMMHGDLAARNVLVFRVNPADSFDTLVKITGFGLTSECTQFYAQPSAGLEGLPVRYMPPEALARRRFSGYSDIWAFGVFLWELFSHCQFPYEGVHDRDLAAHLTAGNRLSCPPACPQAVYVEIMRPCWAEMPAQRPSFEDLSRRIRRAQQASTAAEEAPPPHKKRS